METCLVDLEEVAVEPGRFEEAHHVRPLQNSPRLRREFGVEGLKLGV